MQQYVNNKEVSVTIGDIHVHEVQHVCEFADAIIHQLPNVMMQQLHKRV